MTALVSSDFFRHIASSAAQETLPRFRQGGVITNKFDVGFDPVTEADRAAEQVIRAHIQSHFPDHGIIGEEFGTENEDSNYQWVIDPIDGTRAFISGVPLWGTLVGLTEDGHAVAGMMSQPFTSELYYTLGDGSFYEDRNGSRQISVRETTDIAEATLFTTCLSLFNAQKRSAYDQVAAAVRLTRYSADCYAYVMLASGNIDLVVECDLQPYDIMALIPIIRQAGGIITTWDGGPAEQGGDIVAAATPELHAQALALLRA